MALGLGQVLPMTGTPTGPTQVEIIARHGGLARDSVLASHEPVADRNSECLPVSDHGVSEIAMGYLVPMTRQEFIHAARIALPSGYMFDNPGGGTSRILSVDEKAITYLRRNSSIRVQFADLFRAYDQFKGRKVSSTDLRGFAPAVFDSNARPAGHSCNCTFLFHLLQRLSLTDGPLEGRGVRGDPFSISIRNT
jgi:hypothetical protein